MELNKINTVGVVGAGLMGHGIAQSFALYGYNVNIFDLDQKTLKTVPERIRNNFKVFIELELVSPDDVDAVIKAWEGLTYNSIAGEYYMRPCDHQVQCPVWIAEVVKENRFFKHAFVGEPTTISAKETETPCAETGCTRIK